MPIQRDRGLQRGWLWIRNTTSTAWLSKPGNPEPNKKQANALSGTQKGSWRL